MIEIWTIKSHPYAPWDCGITEYSGMHDEEFHTYMDKLAEMWQNTIGA